MLQIFCHGVDHLHSKTKQKKPSKNKRCSKPPTKVEKEKYETFTGTFQEVVDKKDHGIHDFPVEGCPTQSDETKFYGIKTFSPPTDWIEPVKRCPIWSHMDTLEHGLQ